MDLLLTHGYFLATDAREQQVMKPYPPLGILYLSSHLKAKGVDVAVFDSTFSTPREFEAYLREHRPRVVGIAANLATRPTVLRLVRQCREQGSKVVVGGPDLPHHADLYLEYGADATVFGEGEVTLQELLPRLLSGTPASDSSDLPGILFRDADGKTRQTAPRSAIRDLDAQPHPDREAIDIERYLCCWRKHHGTGSISISTARGCPYSCRWCSRTVFGESYRRRSPARVADEIQQLVDRYHPDMLWYVDDVFTINKDWILRFDAEMTGRKLRVPFECISRPERIDEELVDALVRLGCFRLWLGSESGSQRVLDAMSRRTTVEQVRRATKLLQSRGIQVGMFIMLGYPGEEKSDLDATIDHLQKSAPDTFLTTVAYPIKGTPLYEEVKDRLIGDVNDFGHTDRDVRIRGQRTRRYYEHAQRWMIGAVARHRAWREGRYWSAASAALRSLSGRIGMSLTGHRREA